MQSMTKRDRTLLTVILLALVVFLLGYYVIYPTIKNNRTLKEDIAVAEAKREELENKVIQLPAIRKQYDEKLKEYDQTVAYFYAPMESQEIDRMLTELVLQRGMFCDSLTINISAPPLNLTPYAHSPLNTSSRYARLPGISCANLRLQVWGSYDQCQELLDYMILQDPALRLTRYSWEYDSVVTRDRGGVVIESYDVLTMTMELYMYEARG